MSIPPLAAVWDQPMDPTDLIDYVAHFGGTAPLLEEGETIASFIVAMMPEAVLLGVEVNDDPGRQPTIINAGKSIQLWFSVDPLEQEASDFAGAGANVGVVFTLTTSSSPFRRRQRTFRLTVAQL